MERREFLVGLAAAGALPAMGLDEPPERIELRLGRGLVRPLPGEPERSLFTAIVRLRAVLAAEGICMPLIRVRDFSDLGTDAFAILIHGRVVGAGQCAIDAPDTAAGSLAHEQIVHALERIVRRHTDVLAAERTISDLSPKLRSENATTPINFPMSCASIHSAVNRVRN